MQCYTALMREYELLRSRRKTLALELKKDGTLLVRAPMRLAKREIDRFVAAHEDWIEKHLEKLRASPALPEPTPEETEALKAAAWAVLPERVAYWSTVMGVRPAGIKITTAKKRYGSCSSKHSLCFSCYLMRSPMEAVDLVVAHELCHIQEMNHGRCWSGISRIGGNGKGCWYKKAQRSLTSALFLLIIADKEHGLDSHHLIVFLLRDLHIGGQGLQIGLDHG